MADAQEPTDAAAQKGGGGVEHAAPGGGESGGTPNATQGGSRGAANAMGRHSKEADHSPGSPAELLAIDAQTVREAVASAPGTRRVFHRGRLVASTDHTVQVHAPQPATTPVLG